MHAARALAGAVVALSLGCSGDGGSAESSSDPRRNVLVVDDGFDLTVPVFNGRVAGAYSIVCLTGSSLIAAAEGDAAVPTPVETDAGVADGGADDGGMPGAGLAERKAGLIASLKVRDTSCHLEPGVEPKPDPMASIANLKNRWNATIRASKYASATFTPAEIEEIKAAQNNLSKARFHGTATSGLIAYNNPNVRLVLVEERLGSAEMIESTYTCLKQQDIDDNVALFSDPEVRQAYVDRPSSTLDDDFRTLAVRHRIGVMNESFGTFSRQRLEELQASKSCVPVELRPYFTLLGELDAARVLAHPDADILVVKSAGNDHSQLDGPADHPMCNMPAAQRLIVGAYDSLGMLTTFTNFGDCIDVIGPGSKIIAPIPGNWYLPLSGTSFSAPLTARLISVNPQPVPYTPAAARALVISMRDAQHRIPLHRYPRELLYDPEGESNRWALRLREPEVAAPEPINLRKLREFQRLLRPGR